ncbi:unnamed protein product [Parascedosporium putredinis]|uniref:aldehyde dehydrogenase (NAD(+)) n=1 Tax=Parascedosporium putredinis TaxID=1442378 RepID=A0A9P1H236_9PEZI|nr:unnamed protein product [Parascedosporium putredinis]CAI7993287.1 unnamed protein product [Parascedosporium putredinis]
MVTSIVSCLEPDLIQDSSAFSGQEPGTEGLEPGQAPSATDANNFINFCHGQELTNGKMNAAGSCNGIPMGRLPSVDNMVSAIITNPKHAARIPAYTNFVVSVQTTHLSAGYFVNPATNYYTAPQDLDSNGDIFGHCHIAIQDIGSFQSSTPPDPREFVFFSGILDSGDGHGLLYATVEGGLPPGAYRVCTMISAANHQPVVMPVPQRGAQDDCTKFEVVDFLQPGNPEIPIVVNTGLFINNDFRHAEGGALLEVENPTTGDILASVAAAQKKDVDAAVAAAQAAFQGVWKTTLPTERSKLLHRLADLIERDVDDLASLEALDVGVLFGESKALHIPQATETLRYFAGWADKISGSLLNIPGGYAYTRREAIGVCAAIIPWNAPLMITIWKLAPAIAAGNVLIIKTPELAPLYGQKLAALIKEAGFPAGVINIICGQGSVAGQALAEHCTVRKIAFTGSTAVGRQILQASASSNLKKVTLELGGKGPSIVFPDADLDNALFWTTLGFTANNGQVCAAGSRIYIHASIYDAFLLAFAERLIKTAHGDPLKPETTKGPVISHKQRSRILDYIHHAKESGIRLLMGGEDMSGKGYFVPNTAFADVPDDAAIMKEEIFGPSIAKFSTEDEVIAKANSSEYGLSAAVFTNDVNRAQRVSAGLESGQVTINCWGMLHSNTPFGGEAVRIATKPLDHAEGTRYLASLFTVPKPRYITKPALISHIESILAGAVSPQLHKLFLSLSAQSQQEMGFPIFLEPWMMCYT